MNIETELTPNPETLKFIVSKEYIFQKGIEIKNEKEADKFKFSNDFFQYAILYFFEKTNIL